MKKSYLAFSVCAALIAFLEPASANGLADCAYKANLFNKTATIEVRGGEPVSYQWGTYKASNVYRKGDTIHIDKATLTKLRVVNKKNKKPSFNGRWRYKGSNEPVTFVCR